MRILLLWYVDIFHSNTAVNSTTALNNNNNYASKRHITYCLFIACFGYVLRFACALLAQERAKTEDKIASKCNHSEGYISNHYDSKIKYLHCTAISIIKISGIDKLSSSAISMILHFIYGVWFVVNFK